ncbi:MAG TPA: hypothetical protein DHN29_02220 [Cytophagales bacterium]|nr:hypothetical protein [Cytophagales bacterium]
MSKIKVTSDGSFLLPTDKGSESKQYIADAEPMFIKESGDVVVGCHSGAQWYVEVRPPEHLHIWYQ